jgi:hypothetical protein
MQPDSPYRLIEELGSSTVGQVWSAVDATGQRITVAVLDSLVAGDPLWREAFAAAARARGAAGLTLVSSDFSGSAPWAAFAARDEGPGAEEVFRALGVEYQPASEQSGSEQRDPAASVSPAPAEPSTPAALIENSVPIFVPSASATPVEPRVDAPRFDPPRFDPPRFDAPSFNPPSLEPPRLDAPSFNPPSRDAPSLDAPRLYPPRLEPPRLEPPRLDPPRVDPARVDDERPQFGRRFAILGAFVVAAVVVAGAAVIAVQSLPLGGPKVSPSTPVTTSAAPAVTTPPPQPGVEPPIPGNWPREWVGFARADNARTLNLEGLRFPLQVPSYWNCTPAAGTPETRRYICSGPINDDQDIGGEVVVRECTVPCDAARRDALRAVENAWGQRWRFAGPNATIAETLTLYGQAQTYGVVILGYFSSRANGPIDRQITLRMSCPESWLGDIRKVAVSVRAGAKL